MEHAHSLSSEEMNHVKSRVVDELVYVYNFIKKSSVHYPVLKELSDAILGVLQLENCIEVRGETGATTSAADVSDDED